MPSDPTRDVARNLRKLWDHILSLEEQNQEPEQVVVTEGAEEDMTVTDTTDTQAFTGSDKYAVYGQDKYGTREYK
jgi:hypothetical protein